MADQAIRGTRMGVRDVPGAGMMVRLQQVGSPVDVLLQPAEAAEIGRALIAQADEAIHASRAGRRA